MVFFASDGGLDDEIGINHDERAAAAELSGAEPGSEDWVAAMHKSWEVARCDAGTCALLANVSDTFAPDGSAAAPPDKAFWLAASALSGSLLLCALVGGLQSLAIPGAAALRACRVSGDVGTRIDGNNRRRAGRRARWRGRVDGVRRARRRRPPRTGEETVYPTRP